MQTLSKVISKQLKMSNWQNFSHFIRKTTGSLKIAEGPPWKLTFMASTNHQVLKDGLNESSIK
jgi:hypothetical protein